MRVWPAKLHAGIVFSKRKRASWSMLNVYHVVGEYPGSLSFIDWWHTFLSNWWSQLRNLWLVVLFLRLLQCLCTLQKYMYIHYYVIVQYNKFLFNIPMEYSIIVLLIVMGKKELHKNSALIFPSNNSVCWLGNVIQCNRDAQHEFLA